LVSKKKKEWRASPLHDVKSLDSGKTPQVSGGDPIVEPDGRGRNHQIGVADRLSACGQFRVEACVHASDVQVERNDRKSVEDLLDKSFGARVGDRAGETMNAVKQFRCGDGGDRERLVLV
jgi:hypothetical protein